MDADAVYEVATAILVSVGGAATIIMALSSWLGKVWAGRILEKEKQAYASELENLRTQLKTAAEKQQLVFAMYFEGQFKVYNNLWLSLVELQSGVESLWEEASSQNLKKFILALSSAKKRIQESALLIDADHYAEIMKVIQNFEEYRLGKEGLISKRANVDNIQSWEIEELINQNAENRDRINEFIESMQHLMRRKISHVH